MWRALIRLATHIFTRDQRTRPMLAAVATEYLKTRLYVTHLHRKHGLAVLRRSE